MSKSNTEKVSCRICKEGFPVLATHINRKHNLSTVEYLKRYPGAKMQSDEYIKKVSEAQKNRFLADPTLRERVASRTFDFIKNKNLSPLLQRDLRDAKVCLKNKLWKPSIILYGSIIEASLKEKYPKTKGFYEALEVAYKNKNISEKEYHQIHIVRNLRNFVHLHKELSEESEINEYWARTFCDICESVIKRFNK